MNAEKRGEAVEIATKLNDFVKRYLGKIGPIVLAGLFHRQYAIIHPFMDGNEHTARLLKTSILGKTGRDSLEIFSIDNYYKQNITRYLKAVGVNQQANFVKKDRNQD